MPTQDLVRTRTISRVPRSTRLFALTGVMLVVLGFVIAHLQGGEADETEPVADGLYGNDVLDKLQHMVPNLALILIGVIVVTFAVMYKARPHRS